MKIAEDASLRGACLRRKVGAVIAAKDHRIVATGYNGAPAGQVGCLEGACPRCKQSYDELPSGYGYQDCICIHAEMNAIIYAGRDRCIGGTIYITLEPCYMCRLIIRAAGIERTVWPDGESYY